MAYTLPTNQMDNRLNNILKAYNSDNNADKKQLITKLIDSIGKDDAKSKAELIRLIKSLSNNVKSKEEDLALIKRIIEEID